MVRCVIDNCNHNKNAECTLKDLILNLDMRCACFEYKKKKCKRCGVEFKPQNERSQYCSIKCRNVFNVNLHRGKAVEQRNAHHQRESTRVIVESEVNVDMGAKGTVKPTMVRTFEKGGK